MKAVYVRILTAILGVLLLPQFAHASNILTITFNQPIQSVAPGGSLTFAGTLSFIAGDGNPVYLFGDSIATSPGFGLVGFDPITPDVIMLDDSPFFFNFPLQMSSDGLNGPSSFTYDLFTVAAGSLVTPGTYLGEFDVLGGDFPGDSFIIAAAPFEIDVLPPASVPEPASITLLFAGFGAAGLGIRRFRTTARGIGRS